MLAEILQFDLAAFRWCRQRRHRELIAGIARQVSRSADGWLYVLLPLVYVVVHGTAVFGIVRLGALAFTGERFLYYLLKNTIRRRRPTELLPDIDSSVRVADRYSLPSGHTSGAFLFAALCSLEFGAAAALILYPWACVVGASRVVLGVHFPSDVIAGAVLGSTLLPVAAYLLVA